MREQNPSCIFLPEFGCQYRVLIRLSWAKCRGAFQFFATPVPHEWLRSFKSKLMHSWGDFCFHFHSRFSILISTLIHQCFSCIMGDSEKCSMPDGESLNEDYIRMFLGKKCTCEDIAGRYSTNYTFFNCEEKFPVDHTFFAQFIYCFMFGLLVLCSLGGNLTVVWIILKHERMRTVSSLN
jgi:hypothetical protein